MSASTHPERVSSESPLLWPALALLVIAVACWTYFWDGHRSYFPYSTKHAALLWPPPPETAAKTGRIEFAYGLNLPNGSQVNVPPSGMEQNLLGFIQDSSKPVDKTTWFDFDRLLFDTDKATLQPASQQQLQAVASILKAYPKVHARIGGYTDNTGEAGANLQLSQARATNVMNELVKLGVASGSLDAKGYGTEHPVADNSSEGDRAKNRRISLRVTQK